MAELGDDPLRRVESMKKAVLSEDRHVGDADYLDDPEAAQRTAVELSAEPNDAERRLSALLARQKEIAAALAELAERAPDR